MELFGVRKAAVIEPEFFVETFRIHNERIAFPTSDGSAVVKGIIRVTVDLPHLLTSVRVDHATVAIAASEQDHDAIKVRVFHELKSIDLFELPRPSRRFARTVHRI